MRSLVALMGPAKNRDRETAICHPDSSIPRHYLFNVKLMFMGQTYWTVFSLKLRTYWKWPLCMKEVISFCELWRRFTGRPRQAAAVDYFLIKMVLIENLYIYIFISKYWVTLCLGNITITYENMQKRRWRGLKLIKVAVGPTSQYCKGTPTGVTVSSEKKHFVLIHGGESSKQLQWLFVQSAGSVSKISTLQTKRNCFCCAITDS